MQTNKKSNKQTLQTIKHKNIMRTKNLTELRVKESRERLRRVSTLLGKFVESEKAQDAARTRKAYDDEMQYMREIIAEVYDTIDDVLVNINSLAMWCDYLKVNEYTKVQRCNIF